MISIFSGDGLFDLLTYHGLLLGAENLPNIPKLKKKPHKIFKNSKFYNWKVGGPSGMLEF